MERCQLSHAWHWGNNWCSAQLQHLMDCPYTAKASALLQHPRGSQQSHRAYEPWEMDGALRSARVAMKACALGSRTAKGLTSGATSQSSPRVSQPKVAQKGLNKIHGTLHACTQTTAGRSTGCRVLGHCSGICTGTECQQMSTGSVKYKAAEKASLGSGHILFGEIPEMPREGHLCCPCD